VEEAVGAEIFRIPKEVDFDTAYSALKVIYEYMTNIKEGKVAVKVAVERAEEEVEEEKKEEEIFEEPEITFKDAYAALKPIPSEAAKEELIEKERFDGKSIKVLGSTFEPGVPLEKEEWRKKLTSRKDEINYLKTGLRYWYSQDWYGSEKRKKPA